MMDEEIQDAQPATHPPMEPTGDPLDDEETKWPKVIGVISLIYALFGLLCQSGYAVATGFTDQLMQFFGMEVTTPVVLKATAVLLAAVGIALGIVMLMGAIKLLRRQRSGVSLLKKWAVMRIILVLIGVVAGVLMAPAQIEMQQQMLEVQRERMPPDQAARIPDLTDEQIWRRTMIQMGVMSALFAAYPVFLGFWLSRNKITADVERWLE